MTTERRFFRDVILACGLVLGLVGGINFVVDPFRMNGLFELGLARDTISPLYNSRLWKMVRFEREGGGKVILGDSRCDRLEPAAFGETGATGFFNASFGGATGYELVDAYWHLVSVRKLETLVLCLSFNVYDEANKRNGMPEALSLLSNPFVYYLSPFVLRVSGALVWHRITGVQLREGRPDMTREEFWEHQLGPEVAGQLRFWRMPERLRQLLTEAVRDARARGTEVVLVVPPDHVDLRAKLARMGLLDEHARFKLDLAGMGTLVDLDRVDSRTEDAGRFKDPFHLTDEAAREVAHEIARVLHRRAPGADGAPGAQAGSGGAFGSPGSETR